MNHFLDETYESGSHKLGYSADEFLEMATYCDMIFADQMAGEGSNILRVLG